MRGVYISEKAERTFPNVFCVSTSRSSWWEPRPYRVACLLFSREHSAEGQNKILTQHNCKAAHESSKLCSHKDISRWINGHGYAWPTMNNPTNTSSQPGAQTIRSLVKSRRAPHTHVRIRLVATTVLMKPAWFHIGWGSVGSYGRANRSLIVVDSSICPTCLKTYTYFEYVILKKKKKSATAYCCCVEVTLVKVSSVPNSVGLDELTRGSSATQGLV